MTRHALVTGAGSGIGAAAAQALAADGYDLTVADLDLAAAQTTAQRIGPRATPAHVDVAEEDSVRELIASMTGRTRSISVLVNAAGVGTTTNAPDTQLADWERVMAVNARGTFLCCKHVLPVMIQAQHGAIVNIGSVAGLVGLKNRAAYCASKGAVIALTRAMAVDHVTEGIRINAVCPGTVQTPWVSRLISDAGEDITALAQRQPMGRLGTPQEIAAAVLFLASDRGSFATGTVLTVDGGLTAA